LSFLFIVITLITIDLILALTLATPNQHY